MSSQYDFGKEGSLFSIILVIGIIVLFSDFFYWGHRKDR